MATTTLLRINTNILEEKIPFPLYEDVFFPIMEPVEEKLHPVAELKHNIRTPGRVPSPQPTHLSSPPSPPRNGGYNERNGHRVLRSGTVGYLAPEFKGKMEQQKAGKSSREEASGIRAL